MAGVKISDLPAAPSALLTDVFPVDQGPTTYKETNQQVFTLFQANGLPLTKTDDTNVTMTLGGAPTIALLNATSITLGWTGSLAVGRGGTGNTTFTAYSVICAGTTATGTFQNVSGVGTLNQVLLSQGPGALPQWGPVPGVTPAALTKVDDTNVTLTLGGTPSTALLQATSITAGWTGTLSGTRGGTGVNNSSNTATYAGNLNFAAAFTTSGAFAVTQTYTGITNVTFPTTGTLATTSQIPTPSALTKSDDTNVTLSLGGTPATALLQATSITAGWTGQLSAARGGTGISSLGTGVPTALGINVGTAGAFVVNGGALGTPSSGTLSSCTSLPISTGVSGLGTGVATALAINIGSAGAPVTNGGALGTPSSGNLTNCTFETGSWTPALTGSGAGPGAITYSFQAGEYTKVGNVVYYYCRVIVATLTIGGASGQIQITGLPYAAANNLAFDPIGSALVQQTTIDVGIAYIVGRVAHGQSYINIMENPSVSGNATAMAITNISSSSDITVTGFYFTS